MPAPALLPVETRRLIRSGPLDVPFLLPLFGVFAEGHNEADVGEVLSAVSGATGLNFRVLWDHFDGVGFGGNSGFAIRIDQRTRRVPPASAVGVSRAGRRVFAGRASGSGGSAQFYQA